MKYSFHLTYEIIKHYIDLYIKMHTNHTYHRLHAEHLQCILHAKLHLTLFCWQHLSISTTRQTKFLLIHFFFPEFPFSIHRSSFPDIFLLFQMSFFPDVFFSGRLPSFSDVFFSGRLLSLLRSLFLDVLLFPDVFLLFHTSLLSKMFFLLFKKTFFLSEVFYYRCL